MYFVILKLIFLYLYDYVEGMQGDHNYIEPSTKRHKITDISVNKKPVLTLDEASNIIKTIYELSEYTNFKALIDRDFIVGYYEKWHERELKNKFEGINFKTLNPNEQNILRETHTNKTFNSFSFLQSKGMFIHSSILNKGKANWVNEDLNKNFLNLEGFMNEFFTLIFGASVNENLKQKILFSNLPEYIDEQCNVDLARKFNSNWSLGEGEHALCILSRLFMFATTLEEKLYEYKIKAISKVKGQHEGQSDRKSILNDFIEKARGVWLQEASINILENLGPDNEVTMLKNRKMKEKYLNKGLFSTETAKQKAELLGAEFIGLFDIQFGDIDVKLYDQQQHFQPYEIKDVSLIKQEHNLAKEIQFSPALSDKTQSSIANLPYDNLPVLSLDEVSNIIKTIYEFNNYTNFEALVKSDFIVGYYEKWYERELKNKFKDEINFKKLQLDEQNLLRETRTNKTFDSFSFLKSNGSFVNYSREGKEKIDFNKDNFTENIFKHFKDFDKLILSNLPKIIDEQCKIVSFNNGQSELSLGEKEHALCILSRLFIFANSLEEKLSKFKSKEGKSSTSIHHEGQSDRKSILNDFIEKARGVWLQEASINILENLGPDNEVTMLKNRKMKEKYLNKGLFSTETAKQKAELLGAEFIGLFDIQFGDINVNVENQIDLNDLDFDFSDTSGIDFNLFQDLI